MSEHVVLGFDPKFTIVPNGLIESKLSHAAVRVWILLRQHADSKATCYPGQKYISEKLRISERYARDRLKELKEAGWLKWYARNTRRTPGLRTNIYTLLMPVIRGQRNYRAYAPPEA